MGGNVVFAVICSLIGDNISLESLFDAGGLDSSLTMTGSLLSSAGASSLNTSSLSSSVSTPDNPPPLPLESVLDL